MHKDPTQHAENGDIRKTIIPPSRYELYFEVTKQP